MPVKSASVESAPAAKPVADKAGSVKAGSAKAGPAKPVAAAPSRPAAPKPSAGTGPAGRSTATRERSTVRSRFGVAAAAVFCLAIALGGMSLIASKGALPGDPFYSLKRGVENASVDMSADGPARADRLLQLAGQRITDLGTLRAQSPRPATAAFRTALDDLTTSTLGASQLITRSGTNDSGKALTQLAQWSHGAANRLSAVVEKLPAPVAAQANHGVEMLRSVENRATALAARLGCDEITSGDFDAIGLLPATTRCHAQAAVPHRAIVPSRQDQPVPQPDLRAPAAPSRQVATPATGTPAPPNVAVTPAPPAQTNLPSTAPRRTPATPQPPRPAAPGGLLGGLGGLLGG